MEDYVIIDTVLQAIHMSKFKKNIKHLKKYEISNEKHHVPLNTYNISCYEAPWTSDSKRRYTVRPKNNQKDDQTIAIDQFQKNKIKRKIILQEEEKICQNVNNLTNRNCFSQFFMKRQIQPKTYRQFSPRTALLCKSPKVKPTPFYDTNIDFVRKKARKCVIFPEGKHKTFVSLNDKQNEFQINIKQLMKKQWEQEKRNRKIKCATASSMTRHNNFLKQTKKIQQQLRSKEIEQKYIKTATQKHQRIQMQQILNKNIIPLTKDQIKVKANQLMHKYNVDSSRCPFKIITS